MKPGRHTTLAVCRRLGSTEGSLWVAIVDYRKWGKTFVFSWFSGVPRKFFREYKSHSLIILNNEYLWPRQRENISVKTLMALKPQIFSPANLSPSTVYVTTKPQQKDDALYM